MHVKKLSLLGLLSAGLVGTPNPAVAQDAAAPFSARVQPLLKTYCTECHAGAKSKAGIQLAAREQMVSHIHAWQQFFTASFSEPTLETRTARLVRS